MEWILNGWILIAIIVSLIYNDYLRNELAKDYDHHKERLYEILTKQERQIAELEKHVKALDNALEMEYFISREPKNFAPPSIGWSRRLDKSKNNDFQPDSD